MPQRRPLRAPALWLSGRSAQDDRTQGARPDKLFCAALPEWLLTEETVYQNQPPSVPAKQRERSVE